MPKTNSKENKAFAMLNKNPYVEFKIPLRLAVNLLGLAKTSTAFKDDREELEKAQVHLAKQLEV